MFGKLKLKRCAPAINPLSDEENKSYLNSKDLYLNSLTLIYLDMFAVFSDVFACGRPLLPNQLSVGKVLCLSSPNHSRHIFIVSAM